MELQYYGGNCLRLTIKKATVVIDDNLAELGGKTLAKAGDIVLYTGKHSEAPKDVKLVIDTPGEYEVSDISIVGTAARLNMDETDKKTGVMFKILADDTDIVVLGHIFPELNDEQLEALGTVDILVIPVGGNGYTMDATGALKIIKKIEPKLVIPTHYDDGKTKYPVPQAKLAEALKELSMEPRETVAKYKTKGAELTDSTQLVVLEKQ